MSKVKNLNNLTEIHIRLRSACNNGRNAMLCDDHYMSGKQRDDLLKAIHTIEHIAEDMSKKIESIFEYTHPDDK